MRTLDKRLERLEQDRGCDDCPYRSIKRMPEEEIDARIEELLAKGGYYKQGKEQSDEAV